MEEQRAISDEETQRRAAEAVRKYDQQANYRQQLGVFGWLVWVLGTALTAFQLYTALFGAYTSLIQGAIHLGGALGLIFLLYPWAKSRDHLLKRMWRKFGPGAEPTHANADADPEPAPGRMAVPWYDLVLAATALGTNIYIVANYERIVAQAPVQGFTMSDKVVAVVGILLLLEATRRCVGLPIVVIAALALCYGIFGREMPVFRHAGFDFDRMAEEMFFTSTAIFGTPIQVSSTFIFLFLFFGVFLIKTNIGAFFNDIAFALTGRYAGGTAKAAVAASAMQGMVSGSSVANTVASGSFTIPMMKRAGFRPAFAAGTEAAASTGGQLVPPIMGAAVFIMAEYTGVPYNEIIILAIAPAVLYFSGVFMATHFEAHRKGIVGLPKSERPQLRSMLGRIYLFLPLVVIVGLLLNGRTPAYAALWGIAAAVAVSFLTKDTRLTLRDWVRIGENGARVALPVIAACATAGIIAGTVTRTGLGHKLAGGILDLAMGNFALVLVLTMIACLILGMGLPTTANYVVTATVAAPILVANFDVPVIAAHLFVFYFGILADITPPVCLAAYAGAGIARANPLMAGVNAVRLAVAALIVPYVFVIAPVLLLQDNATIISFSLVFIPALVGMLGISAGVMGYFLAEATIVERLLLVAGGIILVQPAPELAVVGLAILVVIGLVHRRRARRNGVGQDGGHEHTAQPAG